MSQYGDVEGVRDSPGALKRKRGLADYTNSLRSQGGATKSVKLADGASSNSSLLRTASTSSNGKNYRSPDSDEQQQSDSGDLLHGVGSASSLNSTASSVFSHNSHATAHNKAVSHANGLTPLTNHTDSSPPKTSSPRAANTSTGMSASNGTHATSAQSASYANHDTFPIQSERPSMHLPLGTAKGYRAVWDPDLESRLSKEERKRATVRRKEFGLEVCNTFYKLLSLRNIIQIT
jgi:histone-lysine N-methyltransferase SETD1